MSWITAIFANRLARKELGLVLTTMTIAWMITGEVDTAIMIGGFEFVLKIFIYYLHERAWQLVPRGAVRRIARLSS